MATLRENLEMEIVRRQSINDAIALAEEDTAATIAQFEELEAQYITHTDTARVQLEPAYNENKHYTAKWPIVYDAARVELYPYFSSTDDGCNPYFPISLVQSGVEKGLTPVESVTTRTTGGPNVRDRDHAPKEEVPRTAANVALVAYPDTVNETPYGAPYTPPAVYPKNATADTCYYGVGGEPDAGTCSGNGGSWVLLGDPIPDPPAWVNTAPELLAADLNIWKADILIIIADLDANHTQTYNNPIVGGLRTAQQYWQDIIDEIDICLGLLPSSSFIGNPSLDWGRTPAPTGALLTSINNLKAYAVTHLPAFVSTRSGQLQDTATIQEEVFFGIVKLRVHQVNGSFSKLRALRDSQDNNADIVADNTQSIQDILKLISQL